MPDLVAEKVLERRWDPSYTRHLAIGEQRWSERIHYRDHTGQRDVRVFHGDIHNHREDIGAVNAICRLRSIVDRRGGPTPQDADRSPLKNTGQPGYAQVIWPKSHGCWDLFAVSIENPSAVYLNSALDVVPRQPIITRPGEYRLGYEVFAENFPVLSFAIDPAFSDNVDRTTANVIADVPAA